MSGCGFCRLGIRIERSVPGHPEQNGAHERMHREQQSARLPSTALATSVSGVASADRVCRPSRDAKGRAQRNDAL